MKIHTTKNGKQAYLYTPNEKAKKYANDLKYKGVMHPDGEYTEMTAEQKAYRKGYLNARRDSADVWLTSKKTQPDEAIRLANKKKVLERKVSWWNRREEYRKAKEMEKAAAKADAEEKKAAKAAAKAAKKDKLEVSPEITNNYSEQVKMDVKD